MFLSTLSNNSTINNGEKNTLSEALSDVTNTSPPSEPGIQISCLLQLASVRGGTLNSDGLQGILKS